MTAASPPCLDEAVDLRETVAHARLVLLQALSNMLAAYDEPATQALDKAALRLAFTLSMLREYDELRLEASREMVEEVREAAGFAVADIEREFSDQARVILDCDQKIADGEHQWADQRAGAIDNIVRFAALWALNGRRGS